ncbi:MAG: LPS assembly protein LptD [Thermoanaerobaculum sp.]|nr:LPS assembly protein LptD [Thermoanaerobaculum sp.]MDW7967333.1 LPS assembly protein LptD [Thermoanaerobaculum sp.]
MSLAFFVLLATAQVQGAVEVTARRQQWIAGSLWCGIGDVVVKYQDITLRSNQLEVDVQTLKVQAEGNVVFDQGPNRLACQRLEFDLKTKTGTFYEVEAFLAPTYHFRGELVEKLDEDRYRFRNGTFTSCTLDDESPPWHITVREATVRLEGYGHFHGAALWLKGVPIFYTPRLVWPVMRERAAGLLVPNVGHNDRSGAYLGNAFFWPISRSFDTTLFLDLFSKGYVGVGQELRWAPMEHAFGEVQVNYFRDPDRDQWEWKLTGRHRQLLPGGWAIKADALDLSDINFFQRFERTFDPNALRRLPVYLTVTRTVGHQMLNLRLDHEKTFFQLTPQRTSVVVLERQPQVEYRLRPTQVGRLPLYLSTVAEASRFRVNRSATLRGKYARVDIFPQLTALLPSLPWLSLTPTLGARATYYTSTYTADRTALVDRSLLRQYGTFGLTLTGPSFARIFVGPDRKLKHLIEPRVEYTYVSDPGPQGRVPVFDERDGVTVSNRLRWTLANRLFIRTADGTRELGAVEVSQDYSFSQPLSVRYLPRQESPRGPLSVALHINPSDALLLDARASYDAISNKLTALAVSSILRQQKGYVNLTYFSSFNPISGATIASQAQLFFGTMGESPWRWQSMVAYDLWQKNLLRQEHTVSFRGSCWAVSVQLRDYRIPPHELRDYRIILDLTGIGTLFDIRGGLQAFGK